VQVAETFDMEAGGESLRDVARLDTCVTVIDASNLQLNLTSIEKVKVRCPRQHCNPVTTFNTVYQHSLSSADMPERVWSALPCRVNAAARGCLPFS